MFLSLLYPHHLCRGVYSFRLSVRMFVSSFIHLWFFPFVLFVCLCWGLTSQSTIFQSCRDGATASWVINQYFRGVKCLAQGHNTAAVGLEPPTSRSGVRHSTTEPPRSPFPFVELLLSFTLKFLKWGISQQPLIRKHSYLDHRYPGAFIPWLLTPGSMPGVGLEVKI